MNEVRFNHISLITCDTNVIDGTNTQKGGKVLWMGKEEKKF